MPIIKVITEINDLQSQFPDIAGEWHPTRNGVLKPSEVLKGSTKKVWWQCSNHPDHEWDSQIIKRTALGRGCPICAGKKVLEGFNDLKSTNPEIAKEWHPTKNGDLKPTQVTRGSARKVWWKCSKNPDHEWDGMVSNKSKGSGCPICAGRDVLEGYNDLNSTEPELAKEWHPTRNSDLKSTEVTRGSEKKVWWQCRKYPDHEWVSSINHRSKGGGCPICAGKKVLEGFNDLKTTEPKIAEEWHPTKNGDLKPTEITRSSDKKVWWQCSNYRDHEWNSQIKNRSLGNGCPICSVRNVLEGFNDLNSTNPKLAKEWHPTRNSDLKPTQVRNGSGRRVWWQCAKYQDHEWEAPLTQRTGKGSGCPICAGRDVLEGYNDLNSTEPELAKEWHPTRNGDLKPTGVTRSTHKKVWWQCSNYPDHEWNALISSRSRGGGCPICAGKKVLNGFNDLKSTEPDLAREWHLTRNGDLKPTDVTKSGKQKVWWQCSDYPDHEWQAHLYSRTIGGGCPICSGKKVLKGFNDLESTDPVIAKEWHSTKNGDLKPTDVTRSGHQKVWWQCSNDPEHEWVAQLHSRAKGSGCPVCAEYGFNPGRDACFYLMQRPGEQQLGISNVLSVRLRTHEKNGWTLLEHTEPAPGQKVLDTETLLKKWLKKEIGVIEGTTENWSTTSMEVQSLAELKAKSGIETDLF